jgi:anti-sigma regulatory factor (Ser/Thr protein kinase)
MRMSVASPHTLLIENRLGEMARVERWLAEVSAALALSQRTAFAVDLVINEAVANVISYAYRDTAIHPIRISLALQPATVIVEVEDDGEPFDPFATPPGSPASALEDAAIGGRGILLIRSYTTSHEYRRVAGRNRLLLAIPRDTEEPEALE